MSLWRNNVGNCVRGTGLRQPEQVGDQQRDQPRRPSVSSALALAGSLSMISCRNCSNTILSPSFISGRFPWRALSRRAPECNPTVTATAMSGRPVLEQQRHRPVT